MALATKARKKGAERCGSLQKSYKWWQFISRWKHGKIDLEKLQNEQDEDAAIQRNAVEAIIRNPQAKGQWIEIYRLEDQNLIHDTGRRAGRIMKEVSPVPGADHFGDFVFNYYGRMRDENNHKIDQLIQQMASQ